MSLFVLVIVGCQPFIVVKKRQALSLITTFLEDSFAQLLYDRYLLRPDALCSVIINLKLILANTFTICGTLRGKPPKRSQLSGGTKQCFRTD